MTQARSPAALAAGVANRALAGERWALEKLAAHAGRSFTLESGPLSASYVIGDDGSLEVAPAGAAPSLTLTVSPLALPSLAADPTRWRSLVTGVGDENLATAIEELALTFPWFVERAFGAALGPVLGQKVADVGRVLLSIPGEVSRRAASGLGRFASESDLIASRADVDRFAEGTADAERRTSALEARVGSLARAVEKRRRRKVT
ncbi:hypothetical protein BURK1_03411 [Burkholderiales bacterium]|nr:hypothetical protein BURK1_03411 [Burkholderiales bacterium]